MGTPIHIKCKLEFEEVKVQKKWESEQGGRSIQSQPKLFTSHDLNFVKTIGLN